MVKKYDDLSPFELKDKLMSLATSSKKPMLNAGRGNPNFFNVFVREIFAKLQLLVMKITETKKHLLHDLDIYPNKDEFDYDKLFRKGAKKWNKRHAGKKSTDMRHIGNAAAGFVQCLRYRNKLSANPDT